ncbi:hypothetical protein ACPOL_6342 [Acidisarcina polymorpha]|uniref:Uncharacterized protein n=1 Tax=Acidisarcina polymorpha TaxID=2211140 RepID=A0A2Z5GAF5_9BACT|nr:hypothetical protein ACPOL_6342 [Acidisarcina polymorpha]
MAEMIVASKTFDPNPMETLPINWNDQAESGSGRYDLETL